MTNKKLNIQILSDLHLEFYSKKDVCGFISSLVEKNADILILAGDIVTFSCMELLKEFCQLWPNVIYVTGNHEYYHSDFDEIHNKLQIFNDEIKNFHWLNNSFVTINNQRFVGSTLWFSKNKNSEKIFYQRQLNDFRMIKNFRKRVFEENNNAVEFFKNTMKESDIVISHHMPHPMCIDEKYKNNITNCFFVCDLSNLIEQKKPRMWINGHTHESFDFTLECGTRLVCNPYGYQNYATNIHWKQKYIIQI